MTNNNNNNNNDQKNAVVIICASCKSCITKTDIKNWWIDSCAVRFRAKCVCSNIKKWLLIEKQYTKTCLYAIQQKHYLLLECLLSLPTKQERTDSLFLRRHYFYNNETSENNDGNILMDCIWAQDERLIEIVFNCVPYLFLYIDDDDINDIYDNDDEDNNEEKIDDAIISLVKKMKQYTSGRCSQ